MHTILQKEVPADLADALVAGRAEASQFVQLGGADHTEEGFGGQIRNQRREPLAASLRHSGQLEPLCERQDVEQLCRLPKLREAREIVRVEEVPDLRTRMNNNE